MTKVYLIRLEGMGDSEWKLVDQVAWDYLMAADSADPIPPEVPAELIRAYLAAHSTLMPGEEDFGDRAAQEEDARAALAYDLVSSSPVNDIALALPATEFNGQLPEEPSVRCIANFCVKHGLSLTDEYEGSLY